jgi:hypothetical protein
MMNKYQSIGLVLFIMGQTMVGVASVKGEGIPFIIGSAFAFVGMLLLLLGANDD